ncbi:hypothetical protein OUZ56_022954 [Daphnia magna]|uniref:Tox-SGS domain-containing protein n=1 Tax=Daphnia magna TaxID=35525 RepID=A0ABR0AXZ0_9CRUS|nr:hypothetical protein OUZ56_022954 [Daphnia magna]
MKKVGPLLLGGQFSGHVDDVFVQDSKDNNPFNGRIYLRHGANLVAFNVSFINKSSNWNQLWNHQFFKDAQRTSYPLRSYPWLITNTMLDDGSDGIVLRNEDGIGFYRFDPNKPAAKLQGLSRDTSFRDLYGWGQIHQSVVLIGRFYRNTQLIGVMSRINNEAGPIVQFYAAAKDRLESRKPHPLLPLQKSMALTVVSKISKATDFYVADIQRNGQDNIILRKETQLEMYQFDEKYELQQVAKVSLVDSSAGLNERFFFVNLTGRPFRDIIHFTQNGLFVYQQNTPNVTEIPIKDYSLIHYHAAFSEANGWMQEYDQSIRLVDTNGDGQDDLLFTGPKGLTVLEFDANEFFWRTLLNPSSLIDVTQRFAIVVGATKAVKVQGGNKESFLLTVDEERKLYLNRLSVRYPTELPEDSGDIQTIIPTVIPVPHRHSTVEIPVQVKRVIPVAERPILRWTEQHAEPMSLTDTVDPVNGAIHFELPIFKSTRFYDAVLPHSISLSYDSQRSMVSNVVGLGWTLSLPDNYISVDYRNSIFIEDWAFYLTVDGVFFRLTTISSAEDVLFFREPTLKCDVEFHQKEQRWSIQTETETFTYGSGGTVQAIRWNLHWPHWRGLGHDVKSLQRVPVAWYLIQRRVKATGRIITYHYDIDTIEENNTRLNYRWTGAIRLKKIESSATITFDYARKQQSEYPSFDHLQTNQSSLVLFPVPLRESHYLTGCQITAEDYRQRLEFVYQTDKKSRRLLKAIEQPINADVRESIFRFKYHAENLEAADVILNEIQLPKGLKVHFQHSKIETVVLPDPYPSVSHPVDEQPAIAYSQQYAVMAFRQRQLPDKIQLKILGTDSFETVAELTALPATKENQVLSYDVRAYADFCLLLLKTNQKHKMCLFSRIVHDGIPKWNKDPTCFLFDHGALMRSSEAGVVLLEERSDVIRILDLNKSLSKWNEHQLKLPFSHVVQLEMFNHMVVGYDDRQLFICYPQRSTGQWQLRNIEQLDGLFNSGSSIVKKFRLPSDAEKILIKTLKEDVLQLSSNMIAITSLHLNEDQQLLSKMRLYLLDAHFDVVRRREFTVRGERILELRHRVEHEGTGYQLAYQVTDGGFFRLRIVNVSGKLVEETLSKIEQEANRNFNMLETEWKKNITHWRERDFKSYDKLNLDQFDEWKKMATGQKANNPKEQTKGKQPTCDDVSYAPCNRYCHEMEALPKNKRAKLDDATRIKKNWDECYAANWKTQWERNTTIAGEKNIYQPMGEQKNKITQLKIEWMNKGIDISSGEKESQDILASLNANKEFQNIFDNFFVVNWSLHRVLMTPQGLQTGNGTLIQMMGDDWILQDEGNQTNVKENVPFSISLGNSFVLEEMAVNHQSRIRNWTLYGQDTVVPNRKIGPPLHQLQISPPDKIINRYPIYLAYQTPNNNTIVVSFDDDGKVLGSVHTFANEQLMTESSSYERLATLASLTEKSHPEKMQFSTRSLRSINDNVVEKKNAVKRIKMSNSDVSLQRFIGYEWDTSGKGHVTVTVIPGNDRKLAGWIRQTWTYGEKASGGWTRTASEMFDAGGHSVQKTKGTEENSANPQTSDSILWDATKQRIVSDFSPFNIRDQMVSYYGFERYEVNNSSSPTRWRFAQSDVADGGFSLTGSSHLRLKANNKQSTLEGIFIPTEQNMNYFASCWIRPSDGVHSLASTIETHQITNCFKAIVSANETEVVGLLGRIMRKAGDWLYVEVVINFDIIRRLYDESLNSLKEDKVKQGKTIPQFAIKLKVEAELEDGRPADLDVDHIRFTPTTHDFKATVYDLENELPVSIIGSSGSISRTVYYRGREMAVIEDVTALDGRHRLEQVATSSFTGHLLPTPKGLPSQFTKQPPCRIVFYPENGGLYETFDTYAWRNRWIIPQSESRNATWTVAPGRLRHSHWQTHHLVSADPSVLFGTDSSSAAIRCYFSLISSDARITWKLPMGQVRLSRKSTETFSTLTFMETHDDKSTILTNLPNNGELIVLTEGRRLFIWIDSVLLMDDVVPTKSAWSSLIFEAEGDSLIEDCIFMGNPRMEMEYLNEWGEMMQTIQLETDTSVLVSHSLYDALGRPAIKTKLTRITSDGQKPLLTYYSDFVRGPIDPSNPLSVWKSHRLRGEVDRLNALDRGVPYFRVEYDINPLNEKVIEGLPGPAFTVSGPFAKKTRTLYSPKDNKIDVVDNHFPTSLGFRHKVEELANGTKKVAVLDENENRIALYVYVPGYDHLLSTYEYDSKKRLIKMLPPIYHFHANTLMKAGPLSPTTRTKANSQHLSTDEIRWQQIFGTFMNYDDETDRLISKTTPDTGTFNYYYNRAGQVRLEVHSRTEETDKIDSVVFYEYDVDGGTVTRTGYLEQMPMSREKFRTSLAEGTLMNAKSYQFIDRADKEQRHYDPSLSRDERNATFVTKNSNYGIVEEMRWDSQDRLVELKQIVPDGHHTDWQIRKTYYPHSNRLRSIEYPATNVGPIQLKHHYNKLGQLIELTLDGRKDAVVRFTYHGSGQLASESFQPGSQSEYNRTFHYNSPGFLERICDPYLTESISYTEDGYGQSGYGDGIVMKTKFDATWSPNADWRWFQIADGSKLGLTSDSSAQLCFNALERNGYITKTGRPLKDYYYPFSADGQGKNWMPLVCGGRNGQQLAKILAQKRMPKIYGHRYAYGHHQELVKAKYFSETTEKIAIPFQPDSLANQSALTKQQSRDIWKKLDNDGFILTDERNSDWLTAIANPAKSLLRSADLNSGLKSVATVLDDVTLYQDHMEKLILNHIGQGRNKFVNFEEFHKMFLQWKGMQDGLPLANEERFKQVVGKVHKWLGKTKDNSAWLDPKLTAIFRPSHYSSFLTDFIRILCQRFTNGLGQHPFDVASYEIDANGNHRKFYTGFHRYEFSYDDKRTNQIRSVRIDEPGQLKTENEMIHDSQGNVIQALHKGIQRIEYNTASKRTTAIHLTDGRIVRFAYDGHGERTLKQVLAKDGQMIAEVHYLRDEDGRVLFDQRTTYSPVMALLPELRDAESMAVTTAYIYGPRGLVGFLRNGVLHGVWSDHSGSIRLVLRDGQVVSAYDYLPYGQLMRVYGSDPAAAIAYRYTGKEWDEETGLYNYHARLYDPDIGRFYQPDPRAQYFSPYKYVGNSPLSLVDPDGEFGLLLAFFIGVFAVGGAYLGGAAANDNWNPAKWNYRSGATWLGIIGGGIAGGFTPITAPAAVAAIGLPATFAAATATAYISAAAANGEWDPTKWDFDRPGTYNAIFQGASTAFDIIKGASIANQFANKIGRSVKSLILTRTYGTAAGTRIAHQFANKIGRSVKSLILTGTYGTAAGMAYIQGVLANDGQLNPFEWDFSNPATLSAMLDGIDFGIGLPTDLAQISQGIYKLAKKSPKQLEAILSMLSHLDRKQLIPLFAKAAKGPLGKAAAGALTAYLMNSLRNGNFDPSGWDGSSFSTYEGFFNGLNLGVSARNVLKAGWKRVGSKLGKRSGQKIKLTGANKNSAIKNALDSIRPGKIRKWMKTNLLELEKLPKLKLANDGLSLQFSSKHLDGKMKLKLAENQLTSNRLAEIEAPTNQIRKRRSEVFTDREIGSMGCGMKRVRRRKRGNNYSTPCKTRLPDPEAQTKLNDDPIAFLKETPISTSLIVDPTFSGERIQLANGDKSQFQLVQASDSPGYHLRVGSPSSNDAMAVEGYWLTTREKIRINPLGETRFIFTPELQGCSIYVKYDYNNMGIKGKHEPQMTVYHHFRKHPEVISMKDGQFVTNQGTQIPELTGATQLFDANGNVLKLDKGEIAPIENIYRKDAGGELKLVMEKTVQENRKLKQIEDDLASEYDIAIRYEDYLGLPSNYQYAMVDKGLGVTVSTPILFRDTVDNQWYFASQKVWYQEWNPNIKPNFENFKIYPELHEENYVNFRNLAGEKLNFGEYFSQWRNNLKTNGVFIRPLNSIPRSQSEADSLGQRTFPTRKDFKDYVQSVKADIVGNGKPASNTWQDQIEKRVDVGDLDGVRSGRSRRSPLTETRNITYTCQRELDGINHNETQSSFDSAQYATSSASRPRSWVNLLSLSAGRQIIKSITSIDYIFEFLTTKTLDSTENEYQNQHAIDLSSKLDSDKTDYRDVTIGNCLTFSEDAAVVCYGLDGQTLLFAQSADRSLPLEHAEDTFRQCRPIEWNGKPSVTCRGEKTTFIHTPYERTSAAVHLLNAVDGWLLLAYAAPGFYREVGKFFSHVKNVWAGSARVSIPINKECKESWQKQMRQLDQLVAKCEIDHVKWALPLIEETRQQIESLMDKTKVETTDDARAVKTMTERLTALVEDVGELVECGAEDEVFYDCLEECPAAEEPTFNKSNNSAESISAGLHHMTHYFKILAKNPV